MPRSPFSRALLAASQQMSGEGPQAHGAGVKSLDQVNRFYYRHSAGKDIMNVMQLRAAFALTTRLEDQIAEFRRERTNGIKGGTAGHLTPPAGPTLIMHIAPFESFRTGFMVDLEAAMKHAQGGLLPLGTGGNGHRYNLDGIYCFDDLSPCNAYTQVFRNGIIEASGRTLLRVYQGRKLIPCEAVPRSVLQHLTSTMAYFQKLSVPPPFAAMLTLVNVSDYEFPTGMERGMSGYYTHRVDRDDLRLPAVIIQDFDTSPVDTCRPMFDALFNAAGLPKWPDFDRFRKQYANSASSSPK